MFLRQVQKYEEKFNTMLSALNYSNFQHYTRGTVHWDDAKILDEFKANSEDFQNLVYSFAKTLMPGKVSCTGYGVVIALVASHFNLDYKVYSGFCLPKSYQRYDVELEGYNKGKESGKEHPVVATHVYVMCGNTCYEYYNGNTSDIEHIDCVEICK